MSRPSAAPAFLPFGDTAQTISLAISPWFHNKDNTAPRRWTFNPETGVNEWRNDYAFGYGWQNVAMSKQGIIDHSRAGNAIVVCELKGDHRNTANFVSSQVIGIDLDGQSVGEALANPFIRAYAFYVCATPSNGKITEKNPDALPRSRAFFWLDQPITNSAEYIDAVNRIMSHIKPDLPSVDESTDQAAQIFFGSTDPDNKARLDKTLPLHVIFGLPVGGQYGSVQPAPEGDTPADYEAWLTISSARIAHKLGATKFNSKGWSEPVCCPFHDDKTPSASWNNQTHQLKCHSSNCSKGSALIKDTAAALGVELPTFKGRTQGLHTSTREWFTSRKDDAIARFIDCLLAVGVELGQEVTIAQIASALQPLNWSEAQVRRALNSKTELPGSEPGLFFCADNFSQLVHKTEPTGQENNYLQECPLGVGVSLPHISSSKRPFLQIIQNEPDSAHNQDTPQQPEGQDKPARRGPKEKTYYLPTERQIAARINTPLKCRERLTLADLETNATYRRALDKGYLQRNPGQEAQKVLGARVGVSDRTIRRYHKEDDEITAIPMWKVIGEITEADLKDMPEKSVRGRWLQHEGSDAKKPYNQQVAEFELRRGGRLLVVVREANYYLVKNADAEAIQIYKQSKQATALQADQPHQEAATAPQIAEQGIATTTPAGTPKKADIIRIDELAAFAVNELGGEVGSVIEKLDFTSARGDAAGD